LNTDSRGWAKAEGKKRSENSAARQVRPASNGLLLLYPISRHSGYDARGSRRPVFDNPDSDEAVDLVGLAISFPESPRPQRVEAYLQATVGWRPIE